VWVELEGGTDGLGSVGVAMTRKTLWVGATTECVRVAARVGAPDGELMR
jgi:hypothetical protein